MMQAVDRWKNEENIVLIAEALETLEVIPFYGTLLGLTRSGGAIEGDDDVDFWVEKSKRSDVISLLENTPFEIGFADDNNHSEHFLQATRQVGNTTTYVDFYFYEFSGDGQHCIDRWNWTGHWTISANELHVPSHLIFPIKSEAILGVELQVPAEKEALCEFLYGEGWALPMSKGSEYKTTIANNVPVQVLTSSYRQLAALEALKQARDALHQIELRMGLLSSELEQLSNLKVQINEQMWQLEISQKLAC